MSDEGAFEIYLDSEEEEGGKLRTTHNRPNEVQRKNITHRPGALMVQGELVETVHGQLGPDGEPATLCVFDFRASNSRRFKKATIVITFADDRGLAEDGPDVVKVAPMGTHGYYVTSQQVELKHSVNATASGGAGPANLSAGYTLERTTSKTTQDQIRVTGASQFSDERTVGEHNQAVWILTENESQKSGIPTHLRGLVLLQRQERDADRQFTATIDITTKVDFSLKEKVSRGKTDVNDPIIFDPRPEAQPRKLKWAKENEIDSEDLDSVQLETHQLVATMTRLPSS